MGERETIAFAAEAEEEEEEGETAAEWVTRVKQKKNRGKGRPVHTCVWYGFHQ